MQMMYEKISEDKQMSRQILESALRKKRYPNVFTQIILIGHKFCCSLKTSANRCHLIQNKKIIIKM